MSARRSIEVEGYNHGPQPIPAASRVGPLVMTGGIHGLDPQTGVLPDGVEDQARLMFWNLERIMVAAGAGLDRIVRITVYVKVPEARPAVNAEWLKAFPDPGSRPTRHTLVNETLPANMLVQCDATAFADETDPGAGSVAGPSARPPKIPGRTPRPRGKGTNEQ